MTRETGYIAPGPPQRRAARCWRDGISRRPILSNTDSLAMCGGEMLLTSVRSGRNRSHSFQAADSPSVSLPSSHTLEPGDDFERFDNLTWRPCRVEKRDGHDLHTSFVRSFFFLAPCSSAPMSESLVGEAVSCLSGSVEGGDLSLPICSAAGRKEEIEESIGIR